MVNDEALLGIVASVDKIYSQVTEAVGNYRANRSEDGIQTIETLLNELKNENTEDIAKLLKFMIGYGRGIGFTYLFKIRKACLLLLIDSHAAHIALKCSDILNIKFLDDGGYKVTAVFESKQDVRKSFRRPEFGGDKTDDKRRYNKFAAGKKAPPKKRPVMKPFSEAKNTVIGEWGAPENEDN